MCFILILKIQGQRLLNVSRKVNLRPVFRGFGLFQLHLPNQSSVYVSNLKQLEFYP